MKIAVKKGLDIPIHGKPEQFLGALQTPKEIALSLDPFETIRFRLLVKLGQVVKIGTPLAENKAIPGQMFVSPAGGKVVDIRRGLKRRLLAIVVEVNGEEEYEKHPPVNPKQAGREEILLTLNRGGIFPHIRMRPFDLVANRKDTPRDIFVRGVESLPFVPSAESQVEGYEEDFQSGLDALQALTSGKVHLVMRENSTAQAFVEAQGVEKHVVTGPHPASSSSLHIHHINPIKKEDDIVWTLGVCDVIAVGAMLSKGIYHTSRVIGVGGGGIHKRGFWAGRMGIPIQELLQGEIETSSTFISGDPLTGHRVEKNDFLGFFDTAFSVIPVETRREPFHFLRAGRDKYSASKTYLSGHFKSPPQGYDFTTSQHGEERAFVDGIIYDKVMPMKIPTMHLVKAILAENFELAVKLGLLEVAPEDFALPTFIDPSKIEMMEIVKQGLQRYAREGGYIS